MLWPRTHCIGDGEDPRVFSMHCSGPPFANCGLNLWLESGGALSTGISLSGHYGEFFKF